MWDSTLQVTDIPLIPNLISLSPPPPRSLSIGAIASIAFGQVSNSIVIPVIVPGCQISNYAGYWSGGWQCNESIFTPQSHWSRDQQTACHPTCLVGDDSTIAMH